MRRKPKHDGTHLTLDERKIIQAGIENNATKADISRTIGKDATTVAKEIRKHRAAKPRSAAYVAPECMDKATCPNRTAHPRWQCTRCKLYRPPGCNRRDKSPGACNGCPKINGCRLEKQLYNAETAHKQYQKDLVGCREGVNLTKDERSAIAEVIAPLLKQGQSVYQILSAHPEIKPCEKTIYTYINEGLFKKEGIDNFSLKEHVNRKRKKVKMKKRKEPVNYTYRTYADFMRFRDAHPNIPIVEMDTLYNTHGGPYLQTFLFERTAFMVGFLHTEKTSATMARSIDTLQARLGHDMFFKILSVLLADRGTEFEICDLFEKDATGTTRLNIFYCDPMQASQKPHVENNHNYVRDIIPNKYPIEALTQADIDLMFSHINSTPRESLGGKTPYETFSFFYGDGIPELLNIIRIERDNVILKPSLIFNKNTKHKK
jgi:IS30 family transposase